MTRPTRETGWREGVHGNVLDATGEIVAVLQTRYLDHAQVMYRRRLITAAPALLEGCEAALQALEGHGPVATHIRTALATVRR